MDDLIKLIEKAQSHVGRAKELAQKLRTDPEYQITRDVHDIVNAINVLAMANTDVLHVFVRFSGHVNEFHVRASSIETDYIGSRPEFFFNESVYLEHADVLEQLLVIESELTELIIEAREEAEAKAKAEVEA